MAKTIGEWTPRTEPFGDPRPPQTVTTRSPSAPPASRTKPAMRPPPRAMRSSAPAGPVPPAILSQLKEGERLLWSGRGSGFYIVNFQRAAIVIFLLMLFVGLMLGALVSSDPFGFAMPFALVMTCAMLVRAILSPMFDAYAVTSRRIIVAKGIWPNFTASYFPERINTLTLRGARDKGSLTFFTLPAGRDAGVAFLGIERPREVAQLIHDLLVPQVRIDDRMA